MKIPEKIKIGGLTYAVTETDKLTLGQDFIGETLFHDLKINLRPVAEGQKERALIHEIVHCIYDNLGYIEHDEKVIDEIAGAFYALIKDNPEMFVGK